MGNTLLLDRGAWDLVLDARGNIALAQAPYAIAQDVASAVRTFIGECWYDTGQGLPYFQRVLGQAPPGAFLKQTIIDAALTVPGVTSATVQWLAFKDRALSGRIQVTDSSGATSAIAF